MTREALWGILPNGLPQGVAGIAHFTIGKGGIMEQNDLPAACITALNDLIASCEDYSIARLKSPEKTQQKLRGKVMACSEILLKSNIQDLNPRKTISLLVGTKRKVDEGLYNEHIVSLIKKLQGMLESKSTKQHDNLCPKFQFSLD